MPKSSSSGGGRKNSSKMNRFPSSPSQSSSCVADVSVTTSKISNTKMAKFNAEKRAREKLRKANRRMEENVDEKANFQSEIITVWPEKEENIYENQSSHKSLHSSKSKRTSQSKSSMHSTEPKKPIQSMSSIPHDSIESTSSEQAKRFQMMDITITILEITGIVSSEIAKSKLKKFKKSFGLPSSPKSVTEQNINNGTGQNLPIFALATFTRSAIDSTTRISTHIPSLALKNEVNKKNTHLLQHRAIWPYSIDYDEKRSTKRNTTQLRPPKNGSRDRSCYKFSRVLQREEIDENISRNLEILPKFIPGVVDIDVGLICGDNMIHLGRTRVLIPGEAEETELVLQLQNVLETKNPSKGDQTEFSYSSGKSKTPGTRKVPRSARKVNRSNSGKFGKNGTRSFKIDDNASVRLLLNVKPQEVGSQPREALCREEEMASSFGELSIEVGTDNVATLWKTAPHDKYEVVEYSPPSKEEEAVNRILQTVNESPGVKKSKVFSKRYRTPTPSDKSTPKSSPSASIDSPPDITLKRFNKWNCLDLAPDYYDGCNNDLELIEDEKFFSHGTWDTTVNDETEMSNLSVDDNISVNDENTEDHTYQADTDSGSRSWNDSYNRTFDSLDDTQTETTYDSIFFSLDSNNESLIITKDAAHDIKQKSIDFNRVHKARDTLRKFADRIGVEPEVLV